MRSLLKYWLALLIWLGVIFVGSTDLMSAEQTSRFIAPVITATPEYVLITDNVGSTEIQWDTGNGSIGFVFVTKTDQKPVLFASGPKGSQVVPWIGPARYVFELYSDENRRTLLATATVTGNAKAGAAPQATLWRGTGHWLLIVVLIAIVYFAVYLSSTGRLRTTF